MCCPVAFIAAQFVSCGIFVLIRWSCYIVRWRWWWFHGTHWYETEQLVRSLNSTKNNVSVVSRVFRQIFVAFSISRQRSFACVVFLSSVVFAVDADGPPLSIYLSFVAFVLNFDLLNFRTVTAIWPGFYHLSQVVVFLYRCYWS